MALRTKGETGDLLRAVAKIKHAIIEAAETLEADIEDLTDEAQVGDKVPENQAILDALGAWLLQYGAAILAFDAVVDAAMPALGRFVNAPDITNIVSTLDWFQKYLVDNTESIAERDITTATPVLVGEGDGTIGVGNLDINGELIDVGHPGTLRVRCVRDVSQGATAGREEFILDGLPDGRRYLWEEGAPFIGNSYNYQYGTQGISADIGPEQPAAASGGRLAAFSAGQGNLIAGGTFTPAALNIWEVVSGTPTIEEGATRINGTGSLSTTTNFVIRQDIAPNAMRNSVFYAVGVKVKPVNGGSGTVTGTLTVKIQDRDGSTTHATRTVTIGSITVNAVHVTVPLVFFIPATAKDLRIEVELASIGGTAATPTVLVDDVALTRATLVDGKLLAIYDGTHLDAGNVTGRFRFGDQFTMAVTAPEDGILQEMIFNRTYGRYMRSSDTPTTEWEDPTP
jgi:hypothetical protein